jgi:hypothetical protein
MGHIDPFPASQESFLPFHVGEIVQMNLGYTNEGDFQVLDPTPGAVLKIVPFDDYHVVFNKYQHEIKLRGHKASTLNAHTPEYRWHTYQVKEPLTAPQVDDLNAKRIDVVRYWLCSVERLHR